MKKLLVALLLIFTLALTACGGEKKAEEPAKTEEVDKKEEAAKTEETDKKEEADKKDGEKTVLKVGVTPVPHAEIMELIKDDLAKEGIQLELVEFNDYLIPNVALNDKEIDANFFQHEPYFKSNIEQNKLDLVSIGVVHIEPIALYSAKHKSVQELPEGAEIIIPNDATNGARALQLLEKAGLIKLKDAKDINATEEDIAENPKNFKFVPMDAALIAKTYADADAAIINSNFAIGANLNPVTDGLLIEEGDSPYANLVAVRKGEENEEKFKTLMKLLQSDKVKDFLNEKYKGAVVPAF